MRIKALPLSQSKQKRGQKLLPYIEAKILGTRDHKHQGHRPHHSLVPLARVCRLHAHYRRPCPLCNAPTAITASNTIPPPSHLLPRVTCSITSTPHPSSTSHTARLYTPHQLPQLSSHSKQSTHLIKSPLPNRKQPHFPLPRP
jgi:hypothetical protein